MQVCWNKLFFPLLSQRSLEDHREPASPPLLCPFHQLTLLLGPHSSPFPRSVPPLGPLSSPPPQPTLISTPTQPTLISTPLSSISQIRIFIFPLYSLRVRIKTKPNLANWGEDAPSKHGDAPLLSKGHFLELQSLNCLQETIIECPWLIRKCN